LVEKKEDIELEKIRAKKMQEIIEKSNRDEVQGPFILTDSNFNETIKRHSLMVVDCWAAWCGPCRMLTPIIDELAKELAGEITFGKLNVDENPETAKRFNIMGVPTLLVMKEGAEIDRMVGVAPKHVIKSRLKGFT
jgi:thioredoxin 1